MSLPHFTNITTATSKWEPVFKGLFEVTVILPSILSSIHSNATTLLLENIIDIQLPTYPTLEPQVQKYKYSTRVFLGMPTQTHAAFNFKLNLNQNDQYQIFCWRIMKDWFDLGFNYSDGTLHYKRNLVGDIIIHLHDKEGHVIRRLTYHNVQLTSIAGFDSNIAWGDSSIHELTVNAVSDYYDDLYY